MNPTDRARRQRYPLAINTIGPGEIKAAAAVLDSGEMTMGRMVERFEEGFAEYVGAAHALMVNSGSSANLLIADALLRRTTTKAPLESGDEVLVPALAWPTTVWPLAQLGLRPVFVDIDPATLALDLDHAREALTAQTRGLFLIHVLGQVPDVSSYLKFCEENGLVLIEDSCETVGAFSDGRHAGTFGVMGSFSCYFSHHLSTVEGGFVVTDDDLLLDDLRSLRSHGWVRDRNDRDRWREQQPDVDDRFLFVSGGYNVRPTEIQAAIGLVQLERLDESIAAREQLARRIAALLDRFAPWLELIGSDRLSEIADKRSHSWMTLPLRLRSGASVDLDELRKHMEAAGVETRPILAGNLARHPGTQQFDIRVSGSLAEADRLLERGLMVGCHPEIAAETLGVLEASIEALGQM